MSTLIWTLLLYSVFLIEKAYTTLQTIDLNGQWVITDESLAWAGSSSDSSPEKGIGLSLLSHTRLVFDLKTTTNGLEKSKFTDIKVGFRTSKKQGILLQMQSTQGDYISLKMNNAGGIKLIVDLGYSRFEINTPYSEKDYTDKRQHEVHMWRTGVNNEIIHLQVDNDTITSAALQFDFPSNIRFLFIGNNDTSSYSGFDGCLFGMSIDNIFLLKLASQNPRPSYITVYPNNTRWSQCQGGEMSNVHNYYPQFCFYKIEKLLTVVGTVPGNIYTSLINNNQIDDPYYRDNDDKYRWIAKDDWSYTRGFQG
ncbi:unnamed protein product [Mytilus coruscus]|uniref:Laminin G domain-containing protein n=1 Tax=Mytilus coruscus TaxID=42192 RepID=A0A6J8BDS3_MYTCO|nr:unnamed protein product [Mytilus coruscus]